MNIHSHTRDAAETPKRRGNKRQEILDAGLALFVSRGFDATNVPAIAREAGIATGTIYRYFTSKEALVNELYRQLKSELMATLAAELSKTVEHAEHAEPETAQSTVRDRFRGLWRGLCAYARQRPSALAFLELHHHAPYLDDESRAMELASLTSIYQLVSLAQRDRHIIDLPAEALMAMVWGAFVGLLKAQQLGHLELTEETLDAVEQCVWRAIARTPSSQP